METIGSLAYKVKFDASQLTQGLMSTRQQLAAAKKMTEVMRSPLERYVLGLQNLNEVLKRNTELEKYRNHFSNQLERQYYEQASAVRSLTEEERKRLSMLRMAEGVFPDQPTGPDYASMRLAHNVKEGKERQAFFAQIEAEKKANQKALMARLAAFKRQREQEREQQAKLESDRQKALAREKAAADAAEAERQKNLAREKAAAEASRRQADQLRGQKRSDWWAAIDEEQRLGREALSRRLATFKKQQAEERKILEQERAAAEAARSQAIKLQGQKRAQWWAAIEAEEKAGREALARRLIAFKKQQAEERKIIEQQRVVDELARLTAIQSQGQKRAQWWAAIEEEQRLGREALAKRLIAFKKQQAEERKIIEQQKADAQAARQQAIQIRGQKRSDWWAAIDEEQRLGREALAKRLAIYKQGKEQDRKARADAVSQSEQAKADRRARFLSGTGSIISSAAGMAKGALIGGAMFGTGALAYKAATTTAEVDRLRAAMEAFTGSEAKAVSTMAQLRDLSGVAGINFQGLANGVSAMLSYTVPLDEAMKKTSQIAAIARGDVERFNRMSLAFGQVAGAGRLMAQENLQMINAGFNPLQEISRTTGISMRQLKQDMEDGKVTVEMVSKAFDTATGAGGRFDNMLEKIGQTSAGAIGKLDASWNKFLDTAGRTMPVKTGATWLSGFLDQVSMTFEDYQTRVDSMGKDALKKKGKGTWDYNLDFEAKRSLRLDDELDRSRDNIRKHEAELQKQREEKIAQEKRMAEQKIKDAEAAEAAKKREIELEEQLRKIQFENSRDRLAKEDEKYFNKLLGFLDEAQRKQAELMLGKGAKVGDIARQVLPNATMQEFEKGIKEQQQRDLAEQNAKEAEKLQNQTIHVPNYEAPRRADFGSQAAYSILIGSNIRTNEILLKQSAEQNKNIKKIVDYQKSSVDLLEQLNEKLDLEVVG